MCCFSSVASHGFCTALQLILSTFNPSRNKKQNPHHGGLCRQRAGLTLCSSKGVGDKIPCISSFIRRDSHVLSDTLNEALGLGSWCMRGDWLSWLMWAPWCRWASWLKWASCCRWASKWKHVVKGPQLERQDFGVSTLQAWTDNHLELCHIRRLITLVELGLFMQVGLLVQMGALVEVCSLVEQVSLVQEGISP